MQENSNGDFINSKKYRFYLKFNTFSTMIVVPLPFIMMIIYIFLDTPSACDEANNFLLIFLFFALMFLNIKQSSEIFNKYDIFKGDDNDNTKKES